VTALGKDPFSHKIRNRCLDEGIDTSLIRSIDEKLPGLYIIQNDLSGERSFYYYRSESAARYLFEGAAGDDLCQELFKFNAVYLSGITLSILYKSGRNKLLSFLKEARKTGIITCFDSNFRHNLWSSLDEAQATISCAWKITQIGLPSFDDEKRLFGQKTPLAVAQHLNNLNIPEIVVKEAEKGYFLFHNKQGSHVSVKPTSQVLDTTGAGDSFNGVYLAYRFQGYSIEKSAATAAKIAAKVITQCGAILKMD